MDKFQYCMVYITTKDSTQAKELGEKVVAQRLAACANIIERIDSFYHWKGNLEKDEEGLLILKTKVSLYPQLEEFIKKHHTYTVPCILAYPILQGNPDYLKWLEEETNPPNSN